MARGRIAALRCGGVPPPTAASTKKCVRYGIADFRRRGSINGDRGSPTVYGDSRGTRALLHYSLCMLLLDVYLWLNFFSFVIRFKASYTV